MWGCAMEMMGHKAAAVGSFPVVESVTISTTSANVATFSMALPAVVNAEEVLLAFVSQDDGVSSTITWDDTTAGVWEVLMSNNQTSDNFYLYKKITDGTEGGKTLSIVNVGTTQQFAAQVYRVSNTTGETSLGEVTTNGNNITTINPAAVTAAWGLTENLYIVFGGFDAGAALTAYPSGYANPTSAIATGSGPVNCHSVYKTEASASDDPSAMTVSFTVATGVAIAVAVRPA